MMGTSSNGSRSPAGRGDEIEVLRMIKTLSLVQAVNVESGRRAAKENTCGSSEIVAILKAHDAGTPTAELARKHGIHPNTLRLWRAKYGGMDAGDVAKVRALTEENERLKRIVTELHLDNHAYKLLAEKTGWSPRSGKPR